MTILSKNDQRGRSMVEMLGVLAIIGVLSVGGISGYSKAMAKFKLTKAQDQISMLLMNIRTAFATSPSYAGLNNGNAVAFAIAPGDMFSAMVSQDASLSQLNNAFGGGAHVYSCNDQDNEILQCSGHNEDYPDQFFGIAMTGLGFEACVSLASSDWGTDGLVGISVAEDKKKPIADEIKTSNLLPLSIAEAGTICGSRSRKSTIVWTYY